MISRENYEIWFINHLDGTLNAAEEAMLRDFLAQNPLLHEELKAFSSLHLKPYPHETFQLKASLLKTEADAMGIDHDDYLLIKKMEEGLNVHEANELARATSRDGSLIKKSMQYAQTRLLPGQERFPHRSRLLRRSVPLVLLIKRAAAVAAVLVVLLAAAWWLIPQRPDAEHNMARMEPETIQRVAPSKKEATPSADRETLPTDATLSPSLPISMPSHPGTSDESNTPYFDKRSYTLQKLPPRHIAKNIFVAGVPNAYELGINNMMPLFLDINRATESFMTAQTPPEARATGSILAFGLKVIDKVTGTLVEFDKLYDEQGKYVAYQLQTPVFKVQSKVNNLKKSE